MEDQVEIVERRPLGSQLTLGGLFLWLTCVLLALGHGLLLFEWQEVRSNEIRIEKSFIVLSSVQTAWVNGSAWFGALLVGRWLVSGARSKIEPGAVLLLALFVVRLPEMAWSTVEAWNINPNDPLTHSIDIRLLTIGTRVAHVLQVALFVCSAWYFRGSKVWLVVFALLAVRLVASFVGFYPHARVHYPISYRSIYEPLHVWSPLALVVLGGLVDCLRRVNLSWLHFLGIVTWIVSFLTIILLSLGVKFI